MKFVRFFTDRAAVAALCLACFISGMISPRRLALTVQAAVIESKESKGD